MISAISAVRRLFDTVLQSIRYLTYSKQFGAFYKTTVLLSPLQIQGKKNIYLGRNVCIQQKAWLAALPLTGEEKPRLEIHDGCIIGHYNEIFATQSIILENEVLTADRVYISDNLHGYEDICSSILSQNIVQKKPVRIGEGSWIGVGAAILGASIGKHCIIGSNAVVTKDIPDYSVAVGIPAKVIKQYNFNTNCWEKIN